MREIVDMEPDPMMTTTQASGLVVDHLRRSIAELADHSCRRPAIQMSGGLDSALLAAALVDTGRRPDCYVICDGPDNPDALGARAVCEALGLELIEIVWDPEDVGLEIREMARHKRSRSLYDIAYGILEGQLLFHLDRDRVDEFWTGNGADILIAGGRAASEFGMPGSAAWEQSVWEATLPVWFWRGCFSPTWTRDPREREPFRSYEMARAVRRIPPPLWWDKEMDKAPLRHAAEALGVPGLIAWRPKSPAQHSSGVTGVIGRHMLSQVDEETDLRVSSPSAAGEDLLLAIRIWVAWQAERAGVQITERAQPRLVPSYGEMLEALGLS